MSRAKPLTVKPTHCVHIARGQGCAFVALSALDTGTSALENSLRAGIGAPFRVCELCEACARALRDAIEATHRR